MLDSLWGTGEQTDRPSNHTSWRCSVILSFHARPQSAVHSELSYVPARQTTLLHRGEKPTADGQHDIKIQEAAVTAQPGDAIARRSGRGSWMATDVLEGSWTGSSRGETSETPDPILS